MFPARSRRTRRESTRRGEIVGTYTDASNIVHGFRLDHGVLATIDYPGATNNTTEISINTRGDVAGFFLDSASQWHDLHR